MFEHGCEQDSKRWWGLNMTVRRPIGGGGV
jgi:hypothetical protein